jgi:hypothetical protein
MGDERRARMLPAWRVRSTRLATGLATLVLVLGWALTTGTSYNLVSHFVPMRAVTAVTTTRLEVGVLVDAPSSELPRLASALSASGMHVSFTLEEPIASLDSTMTDYGDQAVPKLPSGGLVRWLRTRHELHELSTIGRGHHFLYASNGPSVGQWWLAHGAGGRLVAGAVRVKDPDDSLGHLRPGEVIEVSAASGEEALTLLARLHAELLTDHLAAVPVAQLMHDAGVAV